MRTKAKRGVKLVVRTSLLVVRRGYSLSKYCNGENVNSRPSTFQCQVGNIEPLLALQLFRYE